MKKYGRTFHLPQSPGVSSDDKVLKSLNTIIELGDVVITEKMDGENCTIFSKGTYARSPDGKYHPSRDWIKSFSSSISHFLNDDERIVGEYLYAKHSIQYENLNSYFNGFAFIKNDIVSSWKDTLEIFNLFNITPVNVLYSGPLSEKIIDKIINSMNFNTQEGFVVRPMCSFNENEQQFRMGKYVRKNHVQTNNHWMFEQIIKNKIKEIEN